MKKVAIIGAGWYGCHIASVLKKNNYEVSIFEKGKSIFKEASGANQNRLHLGFHYARNHRTRMQTIEGYKKFIETYGSIIIKPSRNLYVVPNKKSLLDFKTYIQIMEIAGVSFKIEDNPSYLRDIEGTISCDEMIISPKLAKDFFMKKIGDNLILNNKILGIENNNESVCIDNNFYDHCVDCTWGHFTSLENVNYEVSHLCVLKNTSSNSNADALTFVDGNLFSIYPTENKDFFTLSSVTNTPLLLTKNNDEAINHIQNINEALLNQQAEKMFTEIEEFYPDFRKHWNVVDHQLSIKTKLLGDSADRSCYVIKDKNLITVMSGKIDTVFYAANKVLELLS